MDNEQELPSRFLGYWTEERSMSVMLMLLVLHLFVLTPARFVGHALRFSSVLFLCLALLAGFLALVRRPALRRLGIVIVCTTVVVKLLALFSGDLLLAVGDTLLTLLCLSALLFVIFRQVSREGPVSAHRIRGAIALYLLIAMLFAFLYGLIAELLPGAFSMPGGAASGQSTGGESFYYFSVVTLTTVGFGDITAVHPLVRSLVMLEALIGQLYPAILIARLVTLELETRRSGKQQ